MENPLVLSLVLATLLHPSLGEDVAVNTKKGPIVGMVVDHDTITGATFDSFLGIPYGEKPTRFQIAKTRDKWTEAKTTQKEGPYCPQPGVSEYNEDCLYLNVFTPKGASKDTSAKYPVMAFIPGGKFIYSSASVNTYGPDFIVKQNVILVTINYRAGALGFLSLGTKDSPGNLGLYDTQLALQWIKDEIAVFGGDPNKVTLFGESAGAAIVQLHYLSYQSTGLFQQAIAQSGSAVASWSTITSAEARDRALQLAKALKCDIKQKDDTILKCLQDSTLKDIIGNQSISMSQNAEISGNDIPFVPIMDSKILEKPFLNDTLENLMKKAKERKIPLISGFCSDDGTAKLSRTSESPAYLKAEANLGAFLPDGAKNNANSIKSRYFNQTSPTLNKVQGLISLYTDYLFAYPAIKISKEFESFTYGYEFAYDGTWDFGLNADVYKTFKLRGVPHGQDLIYLFYAQQPVETCSVNTNNLAIKDSMVTWWTNFAKNGAPADKKVWPLISEGGYFIIDSSTPSLKSVADMESQRYSFWKSALQSNSSARSTEITLLLLFTTIGTLVKSLYL